MIADGKRYFAVFLISFLVHTVLVKGQDNDPIFQSLPSGLSNSSVKCIIRDSKGYMWFGTSDGLTRYDGTNFFVYENDPADSTSLNHNSINAILEDPAKRLWVGTPAGLNLYNREKDNFISIPETRSRYVNAIHADEKGRIWLGTIGSGLNIYDPQHHTLEIFPNNEEDPESISSNSITEIATDAAHNVWIGTRNGLNLFLPDTKKFRRFFHDAGNPNSVSNDYIVSLAPDHTGALWVGTRGGGLNRMITKGNEYLFEHFHNQNSISNDVVLSLCTDRDSLLWIGTENGGLNSLDINTNKINVYTYEEGNPSSISGNSIWSLYADEENILWIGIYGKGINTINPKGRKFQFYRRNAFLGNSLPDDDVRGFAEDKEGNIWIATDGGGLCRFNPATRKFTKVLNNSKGGQLSSNAAMSLLYDSRNYLWTGTWSGGIDKLDSRGTRIKNYKIKDSEKTGIKHVILMYEDSHGNIWAGTSGNGLFLYDPAADKFIKFSTSDANAPSSTAYVTSLLEYDENTLWVGTLYGLVILKRNNDGKYDGQVLYRTNTPGSIGSNSMEIIFRDSKKRIWFGTSDKGLSLLNKKDSTFTTFQKRDGLPGNSIRAILEDDNGFLWISTNKGLSRFDVASGKFRNFSKEDGLNSDEFYARSCFKSRSGEFYFGGKSGFNTFYPDNINENTFVPPVYLTDLKINGKPALIGVADSPLNNHISATSSITLTHEQMSFTIDFVGINYTHSSRNKYAYKLEGFEQDWNQVGSQLSATYTNIDPGDYVFLVKASNNDDVWNEHPAALSITVLPPIWKTWWAMLLYVLFFSSLLFVFLRIRSERIQVKNQLKLERMAREKEHELSQLKMQFFTNISHEFRTPLSLIIAPLDSLITSADVPSKIKDQLSLTYRNAQRMMRLINELMDFRKLDENKVKLKVECTEIMGFISDTASGFNEIAKKRNIDFSMDASIPSCKGWIDRDKIETIVCNLLSNAFKFVNDNGQIKVIIDLKNNNSSGNNGQTTRSGRQLKLIVTDNGIGISPDELPRIFDKFYQAKSSEIKKTSGTGIGLALAKGLVELHHGSIIAESISNHETRFTVALPIDKQAYEVHELLEIPDAGGDAERGERSIQNETDDEKEVVGNEKPHILIVEDNDELRDYLINELHGHFTISHAVNGKEGTGTALEKIPDLIISDIVMPEKSGIELCRDLKSDMRTSHIPIILLTAKTTVEDQIQGIGTGADVYLPKPFNIRLLKAHVKQLIELRRKLYALFSQDVYIMPSKITENELDQAFLQKAIDYIIQNITDDQLNVEALANLFNISRSQVYRKIKALTGKTAVEFIRTIRLKQALKLMETKKYTLAEIAYQTGFTSPSYFTRSFKEQYGKAPSEYLESQV